MRDDDLEAALVVPKAIDNSQVVREVDPRSSRDLWWLLVLGAVLVGGCVLYLWPQMQLRETALAKEKLSRERDRLVEENRKLRLEKATLENLRRVETIAVRDLGLASPVPERVIVVERPPEVGPGARLAGGAAGSPPQ